MILLDNVTLTFPDGDKRITAVDHATLAVERGTTVGITGPSGSGKSSLLAVAATLISPDSGAVTIDDVVIERLNEKGRAKLRRDKLGIIFQQSNLLPALTALDQLVVMRQLAGERQTPATRRANIERAKELLDAVGLAHNAHRLPAQLSGGERQRVNIARALMNQPTVMLVDEPTSALDQQRSASILDLILELTIRFNTATLLVTHDERLLPRLHASHLMVDGALNDISSSNDALAITL